MDDVTPAAPESSDSTRPTWFVGSLWLGLMLAPTLIAIAVTPGFTTQDGPAHVYSARILLASIAGGSPFGDTFRVAWDPLPNWGGHLLTMFAVAAWPPDLANRAVAAGTLVAFAASVLALRVVVAGREGVGLAAALATLLALNVTWLLGFTGFLLGGSLTGVTLAAWWATRDRPGPGPAAGLAALLVLGYFCHPISLGLAVGGLGVLAWATPGDRRRARFAWTVAAGLPLVPLGLAYRALTRSGGGLEPTWDHWSPTLGGLVGQVGWVDPLSLAAKTTAPFEAPLGPVPSGLFSPAAWAAAGLFALVATTWPRRRAARAGWLFLASGLVAVGLATPDTLGVKHGHYLPQRVVLLGLVALVPWLDLDSRRPVAWFGRVALLVALAVQSAYVWDYAATCRDRVAPFLRVAARFHAPERAGTLLNSIRGRFRANPLLHADCLIAAATDTVFWTNYETAQYYFPVRVRGDVAHPVATRFEQVAMLDEPRDADRRARLWDDLLRDHGLQVDKIVEWHSDARMDEATARGYRVTDREGPLRVWTRRP